MTTDTVHVLRESLDDWPSLRNVGLGGGYCVLSFAVTDRARDEAVEAAGRKFRAALRSLTADRANCAVVIRIGTVDLSSRLSRYRLEKEGAWWLAGARPLESIAGDRQSWIESRDGSQVVEAYGAIRVPLMDVPNALTATRGSDAALVGLADHGDLDATLRKVASRGKGVFESASALLPEGLVLVARGFGAFDDRSFGVDVVSAIDFIDRMAAAPDLES